MRARDGAAATILLFAASFAAAWAAAVTLTGGFAFHGFVARSPGRPLIAAGVLAAFARLAGTGRDFHRGLDRVLGSRERRPARIAAALSAAVLVFSVAWNTRAAGGSDSSCYVLQADAFAHGHATLANPVAADLPGAPSAVFAPTGFLPARTYGAAVPICGPGLSLAMAAADLVSRDAVFLVVPLAASLLVWLTFVYGRRLDDGITGASAAALVACSPIFLYQAVQPMSDVPAAAAWLAALVACARGDRRGDFAGGVCASWAVLTRPNLALVAVPLVWLLRDRFAALRFAAAAVPGIAALAWLNAARYGSPWSSGYGDTGALFSAAHVAANAVRYPRWLIETQSPLIALAAGAPWVLWRRGRGRAAIVASTAVMLTFATCFAYTVFDDWWYLRFLLPALPVMVVFMVVVVRALAETVRPGPRWTLPVRAPLLLSACCVCALAAWYVAIVAGRRVFELRALESRFVLTGAYARRALPSNGVVISVQESGSVRFHGDRDTVAWDAIPADRLEQTIGRLESRGRRVYFALEDAEAPRFRERFGGRGPSALDWPPQALIDSAVRVRVFDPAQRDVYVKGGTISTEIVR